MEFERDLSLKEWAKDKPLSILQLDPADRAVLRIADERDAIQKKTFTKWVNKHLKKANRHVEDLFLDLRDGHGLISLLEVLSGEHLPRERGAMRFHMLQNVQIALDFLRYRKIKLVNIRAEDIVDGNPKLTLGLIWTIILHFQISDIVIGQEPNVSARDALLHWARRSTARYPGVRVADFTSSWRDGLAFNAIIHRNRPDLVDWRKIRTCMIRERLEHAFYVAEREYGVTRLLDPEDVDTPEPDEKSLITYISSLYDVFPDPPSIHPLYDSESQQHLTEYRELARNLNLWMREKLSIMNDRNFPTTLIEMKKLAAESSRFRTSEMPPKHREKQQLAHMFRDFQKYFEALGEIDMDPELTIDALENKWTTLMAAHQERDHAILEEIKRLDRLQRLAEKVHREMKQVDTHLEELEVKLDEEVKRLDHLHPLDAKHNVDLLEQDLRITEDAIKGLFNDVQILLEGRYQSAPELHKRIQKLHQRWVALRSELHSRLITKLSAVSFPVEERTVTRQTRTVLETRLVDTNIHFRQLQECSEWCRNKLKQLKNAEYGSDLQSVLSELNDHRQDHKIIEQFNTRIDNCIAAKSHFHGDELQLYMHHLNMLQKLYNELLVTSNKRLSDLETLQDFLHSATNEMVWLNEKEETEVSRDWSEKNLNIPAIEQYYEALMNDLEKREIQFSAVQDRGESLVLQHHPAAKCIESYMTAMQTQWAWLLQLTLCLETHLKHAIFYHKFYLEVHEAEQWISKRDDLLNTTYSQSDFTLDDGERLLKGMQELREELNHYGEIVQELAEHSKDVVPLKLRRHPVTKPLPVVAICNCKQSNIAIEKGDQCILHDNSGRVKWRVTNSAGVDSTVPSVCFLIPPPDKEALDAVDKLKRHYDRSILLWQKKQLRMRQNMIFATIKVVKSWDLAQFLAMGSEQRTAIRRALNEDADKLLQEGDPADPQLRRLRREMEEVNKLFDEFERNARAEEDNKNASRTFSDLISSLKAALDEAEHVMNSRISAPVPRDLDTLEHHVIEHKEFETRLQALNPDVDEVQTFFRRIAKKTPSMQSKLDECLNIWNKLWNCSHLYIERLKCVEIVLSGIEETTNIITEFELKLASYNELPSDKDSLREVHKNLLNLQNAVGQQQIVIDQLNEDVLNARKVVEKSRSNRPQNHDLDRLQADVTRLTNRWKALCNQLTDRLRSVNTAYELLKSYGNSYESQVTWVDGTYDKLNNLSPIGDNAREHFEPTRALLNHVKEKAPVIEQVNALGGQFIREAKIHDLRARRYLDWLLEEVHPSLDAGVKRNSGERCGADNVASQLDQLNHRYQALLSILQDRIYQIASLCPNHASIQQELISLRETYQLRTFRTELTVIDGPEKESEAVLKTSTLYGHTQYAPSVTATPPAILNSKSITLLPGSSENGDLLQTDSKSREDNITNTSPFLVETNIAPVSTPKNKNVSTVTTVSGKIEPSLQWGGSSMQFSEIKSLRRINKVEEGITTDNIIETPGIIHPVTGEILTVGDAIKLRILDVRTGQISTSPESKTPTISILDAAKKNLVDSTLADRLLGPCGIVEDDGHTRKQLSLLEAIQRELLDAEKGFTVDDRLKVKYVGAKKSGVSIADAVYAELVDTDNIQDEQSLIVNSSLALSDAVSLGLVDKTTGSIRDRDTGRQLDLLKSIERNVIDSNVREVVNSKLDTKVTVSEAIQSGILDPYTGKYFHGISHEWLSLNEAVQRQLLIKPMTLKDCCDLNIIDNYGKIFSPCHRQKLSILESISLGILDSESIKCITNPINNKLITLSEALKKGIILPEGKFYNSQNNEMYSIPEAVNRGLISSVSVKSVFDINGFKDPDTGEFISMNKALEKNLLNEKFGTIFIILDKNQEKKISIYEGVKLNAIRPEIFEMLDQKIGIISRGKELTVFESVMQNFIDPETGDIKNRAGIIIPFSTAVQQNLITAEGVALLKSLLSITLTTQCVTRTVKHCITVSKSEKLSEMREYYTDAHKDAAETHDVGKNQNLSTAPVYQTQNSSAYNLNFTSSNEKDFVENSLKNIAEERPHVNNIFYDNANTIKESLSEIISSNAAESAAGNLDNLEFPSVSKTTDSEKKLQESWKQIFELPPDGWLLSDAISQKLFDPVTGLFIIPGTDRLVSFEECVKFGIINPSSASVIDPVSSRSITLIRSLEKSVLDATGHYIQEGKKLTMKEALLKNYVILKMNIDKEKSLPRIIQVTKISGLPTKVEVSDPNKNVMMCPNFTEIKSPSQSDLRLKFLQISTGIIYDPVTASITFTDSNESCNVIAAVKEGKLEPRLVKVKDPYTGKYMNINEAIRKGIIDTNTFDYKDSAGRNIPLIEAIKFGIITVLGSPLVNESNAVTPVDKSTCLEPSKDTFDNTLKNNLEDNSERYSAVVKEISQPSSVVKNSEEKTALDTQLIEAMNISPGDTFNVSCENIIDKGCDTFKDKSKVSVCSDEDAGASAFDNNYSLAEQTRSRVTTEPKFKVSIGRARSFSQSPERDAKPVILQKVRKRVLKPKDAVQKGIMDRNTAELLEKPETFKSDSGHSLTLEEAIKINKIDACKGNILDPQRGDTINIKEAIDRGILDSSASVGRLLLPVARSLSLPCLYLQGLVDAFSGKIIHPETGSHLTLKEALICDIVDPVSNVVEPSTGKTYAIAEAIDKGFLDENNSVLRTPNGNINLLAAINQNMFVKCDSDSVSTENMLPPLGMTFGVALKRGLIDSHKKEVVHPITGERKPVETAIKDDFIMVLPFPASPFGIELSRALDNNLIDTNNSTFLNPNTGEIIPISEAVENGLLVLKPDLRESCGTITTVTQTITTSHAVGGKSVEQHNSLYSGKDKHIVSDKIISLCYTNEERKMNGGSEAEETFTTNKTKSSFPKDKEVDNICTNKQMAQNLNLHTSLQNEDLVDSITYPELHKRKENILSSYLLEDSSQEKPENITLQDIVDLSIYDQKTGNLKSPHSKNISSIVAAIKHGMINLNSVSIRNPENDEILSFSQAVEQGIVNLDQEFIFDPKTGEKITFRDAFLKGYLIPSNRKPFSLEAIIKKGYYNSQTGNIIDPLTKGSVNISEAVKRNIVDAFISECKNSKNNSFISLDDALSTKLVNSQTGMLKDTKSGQLLSLDVALNKGYIITNKFSITLIEAISQGYYSPKSGRILNPLVAEEVTVKEALNSEFVECSAVCIKDMRTDNSVNIYDAIKSGLLDTETGILTFPVIMTLDVAMDKGFILEIRRPLSLQEVLALGFYDVETGLMLPCMSNKDSERTTLEEAIKQNEINKDALTVKDPRSGDILTLHEAVEVGIINPKLGIAIDPTNGAEMHFYDALERGLIISAKRKFSLPEAVFKGLYDPVSGRFLNPVTKEMLPTDKAVKKGVIDPASTLVKYNDAELVTFDFAVESKLIDLQTGMFVWPGHINEKLDFQEAFDRGLLIEVRRPLTLSEALLKGVFSEERELFLDPATGSQLTLSEAITENLIDSESVHVKDTRCGFWKKVSLLDAMEVGLVDGRRAKVKNILSNEEVSLSEAFLLGLLIDSKAPVSLQRAIHQGLYDEVTGKFTDPNSGRKITLHEAIRRFIIHPQLPCYWDKSSERLLSLVETCRMGFIDRRAGMFRELGSNTPLALSSAMDLGLIVDIETAGFGLYEAITMGLYDYKLGRFIHPSTGRKLTLNESCKAELINPLLSIIKHYKSNEYMKLPESIKCGLINDEDGVYTFCSERKSLNLLEAKKRGYIVSARRSLDLEEAIKNGFYITDSGSFVDPNSNKKISICEAIETGFIESKTTALKNPVTGSLKSINSAIEDGSVDYLHGRVLHPITLQPYSFDDAFENKLLVTVECPVTFQQAVRIGAIEFERGVFVDPRTSQKCTLEEAIKYELIDPESAVVKDPLTGDFRTLKKCIVDGTVDINKRAAFDPQTGKAKSVCIIFDQGTVIFLHEPLSFHTAVEQGQLNVNTGKFTDSHSKEILTLKDAVSLGLIDNSSALIKDKAANKLLKLSESFSEGLMDEKKGTVLDLSTSSLYSLSDAINSGLIITPQKGLSLIECMQYGLYNPDSGRFFNPFEPSANREENMVTLAEALESGLINPLTTAVKNPKNGSILPLMDVIKQTNILDVNLGRMLDTSTEESIDFITAWKRGFFIAMENRQVMEEKYKHCDDSVSGLLLWLSEVEDNLAHQDIVPETSEELRKNISSLKQIRDDLDAHSRPVVSCFDQIRHLVSSGGDVLSADELSILNKKGNDLKSRYEGACDRTDKLLKLLMTAGEELSKYRTEINTFKIWLNKAEKCVEEKERSLSNLNKLSSFSDTTREFVSDVIAHQADLRFITMAAQKFIDESKEFILCLNEYRKALPHRLPLVDVPQESQVRNEVENVASQYRDVLSRANLLSDRLSGVGGHQREYRDALDKALSWMKEVEPKANKVVSEPVGADPKSVEEQLGRAKLLKNEVVGQRRLIDHAKQAVSSLLRALEGQQTQGEMSALENPVKELEHKYTHINDALSDKIQSLDAALVQSQGVQDALDSLMQWLNNMENQLKNLTRPASLNIERLEDQIREHKLFYSEIDSHRTSVDNVAHSAEELVANASNIRLAKKIETKLKDVTSRFEKLLHKTVKQSELLEEVHHALSIFTTMAAHFEQWHAETLEKIESRDILKLELKDYTSRIDEIAASRDNKRKEFEEVVRNGKQLVGKKDVTDTVVVRDKIKALESMWKDLNTLLDEKQKLTRLRSEQLNAYEKLRDHILLWLSKMENNVSHLHPVAVESEILKQQIEEIKPLLKEYRDYAHNIDKVNDLGNQYDSLRGERPDSPARRRSSLYSPIKKTSVNASPLLRTSQEARSPSPIKSSGLLAQSPLSPSGSSGFSSRRSSQDGFHLEELSIIQQQLVEINNRYSLLGNRLSDRHVELESVREEVKRHLDNMRILSSFLDKVQRSLPKETIPQSKEDAGKAARQVKNVLEEMYEKQSLLDSTKTQVLDLLKRKSGALGSDTLHDELTDVVTRWKSLNDSCKSRIKFMEDLKEFYDTHDQISNWLSAKDRMMAALGPISSDSRMVQSQVQQVQVLREEFRTQQPQLDHLMDIGENLMTHVDHTSPDGKRVIARLSTIKQRWADLLKKLEDRAQNLGAAVDTSREFDAGLSRLRDALQAISDQLDDLPLDKDSEELLRKIENLERQLEGQRPLLADAESAGQQLFDVLSDPASRSEIQGKLSAVGKQYNNLQKKLDHRKAEIEILLRDGRQFEASCAKTLGWLADELGGMSERLLVSADRHVLQQQLDHTEPCYKEVIGKEHEIIMLLNKGRDILSRSNQRSDSRNLQRDLDKIQQQWDRLRKETMERHTRLQTCMEHCHKYYRAQDLFLPWLTQADNKLEMLKPASFRRKDIEQQLKELANFRNEVWKHSGEYENNRTLGDTFINACDIDKDIVKSELHRMKLLWDKLNNNLLEINHSLEDTARRLSDFTENLRDLQHSLQRCEDKLVSHDALGGAAKDPKFLDRLKSLREETDVLKKPLQSVQNQANDLVNQAGEQGIDATDLQDEVENIAERLYDLQAKLDDRCSELQSAATAVTQFSDQVKGVTSNLTDLERELDSMKPPGRDLKTVRSQLDDVHKLLRKIEKSADNVASIVLAGDKLVDSGFAPDSAATREQVELMKRHFGRLEERAKQREEDVESVLGRLENFYQIHTAVIEDIADVNEHVKKFRAVSSEVEGIKVQQEDFRSFHQSYIEPLSHQVEDCNKVGQGLIQSAAGGVNTTNLEKDLEKMNDKWNDLKDKLNERGRKLDVGLLQSGKFQEALDGLAKWLTDTEEMVANQKPPSADYKVVKAQLQEQKFLKKMLLDRQNSMSSLFAMGSEVIASADPAEKKAVERQLRELMQRFDNLTQGAADRMLALEHAMKVAKEFQDKLLVLVDWLDHTEKKVKAMELLPTDEERIQKRIKEHNVLHSDIIGKKTDFAELTEVASTLMTHVGEEEASALADKLQDTTDRYTTLVEHSESLLHVLETSRAGLRHLVLGYQDLQSWMDNVEQRLNKYRILTVHTDRLLEQMQDLADLTEEIANRQSQVDSTVDSGLELMKHISNDEALQLKDKLDTLQRRYNDLTSKGAEYLKHAQDALPLVQQFYNCHNRLVDWMMGAEAQLQAAEPREEHIHQLEIDIQEFRPVLETINQIGPQLCQMSPGEGSSTIEGLVTRDNRRFDAIAEQIQRKGERIQLSKQRSLEVIGDIDELLDWFREVDGQLREADAPSSDPDVIRVQLKEHKALNDDISGQKSRVRDVLSSAKKVLRESAQHEDISVIREKMEDLRDTMDTVSKLSSDRLGILEQALPLAEHFHETHAGLSAWLDDVEQQVSALSMPALRPDLIAQQQDRNEIFTQSISEHRPLVEKLNKTGEALIKLCNDEEGSKVQDILDNDNARYAALRGELRTRQQVLEKALQESSQFTDKLEGMLRALSSAVDQVSSADPISAHPPRIRDQMDENCSLIEDLDKREEAYAALKRAANDVINKAGNKADPAVKDIKNKLDRLNSLWNEVQKSTNNRGKSLEDALAAAEKFWNELTAVMGTLQELQESLSSQEPPAVQPAAIKVQQVALQEIKHEIDQTKPEVDRTRQTGHELMNLCGEPDKPEVKKHIEDLDSAWDNITALYAKREENLIDAMEKAMEFHETLQNLQSFLDEAEDRFTRFGTLGSDIDAVKKQIEQLKHFKTDVDPHMVKIEALNRQAQELTERTSVDQAASIKEPLVVVNRRWDELLRGMVERQRQLENALLRLGQFQHALAEILVWINKTNATVNELKPVAGDPQVLEVELAKLKVLVNDIQAHQTSVDTLNDAGRQIIESGKGTDEASSTQERLSELNRSWRDLLQKAADRQRELEDALKEAQRFNAELQDMLLWLSDVDSIIAASKPVGGLPETASEQLDRFMEVYNELDQNRPKVETLVQQGQEYLKKSSPSAASNLQHTLRTLKNRWDSVLSRANDKKIKLEIALKEATEFHDALQAFVDWLTNAEKTLSNLKPVSRVLETILSQIEDHKTFQKDVGVHRETMLNLDKKGTHLKYFSQKQDVILIKNLLISVQHRWERVVSKSAERTRALDHGYKEAKDFHDSWSGLMTWLNETEQSLDELAVEASGIGNDPEKIKARLAKHREFQRALSGKQATYDIVMKAGKTLKERAPKTDEPHLRQMLSELKNKWTVVCAKSVDRQRKLEEALLFSGQFKDAIQALLEWLQKMEKNLSDHSPVHGDLDTVMALLEKHKTFEEDLKSRSAQMESVQRTGQDLEAKASATDAATIRSQLSELKTLWSRVTSLSDKKTSQLEEALKQAEKLHKAVHMLLEWLSDAEMKLRFAGPLPEDEQETYNQLEEHEKFMREMREKEYEKNDTIKLAQDILAKAHPDGATVIKHWITIIQSRWEEVSTWASQREQRLKDHLRSLRDLEGLLEELLKWLSGLERNLITLESDPLPDSLPELEVLIAEHRSFMESTSQRQSEIDSICKSRQTKQTMQQQSRDRKISRPKTPTSTSRPSLEKVPSHLPHIGPRFAADGSKGAEPQFKNPRVKSLWDKWRNVWMLAWDRQRRLQEKYNYLLELEKVKNFSWDDWRKRFLKFMNHKKSRLTDLFRKMDKNNDGLIPREDFIDGIMKTKFETSRLEMNTVADLFDRQGEGLIDWKEFIAALRPDWEERKPATEADKIHDEVKRLVMLCTCRQKFRVFQVGEGKYRFGDSQKLRLVRILRSTVMVRVGGGWVALEEFLVKNDPCRAKGRTNIELREQFILADGVSQSMTAFKPKASPQQRSQSVAGPITKVREKSTRSVPMGSRLSGRTSASGTRTPDSLSDNESASYLPRKASAPSRSTLTPGGSLPGSKAGSRPSSRPGSRPASRQGSKPPSRHGSNLSLDSTDDGTPSRIPVHQRRVTPSSSTQPRTSTTTSSKKSSLPLNGIYSGRPKTPTGISSPTGSTSRTRTPSGSSTPVPGGTKLTRKPSGASDISLDTSRKSSKGSTPTDTRAPFRL